MKYKIFYWKQYCPVCNQQTGTEVKDQKTLESRKIELPTYKHLIQSKCSYNQTPTVVKELQEVLLGSDTDSNKIELKQFKSVLFDT